MLIDSHCHLDYPGLAEDLDGVVSRAADAGVDAMLTIGTRIRQFETVLAIAERFGNVYCSVGTHPHNAAEEKDMTAADIIERTRHGKVIAIGEAGLDYHYHNSPAGDQKQGFRRHIAAARSTGLPLVIHTRDAEDDTASILEEEMGKGAFAAVLHCYTSGPELARRGLALGCYISFSGVLTFKRSQALREIAAGVPADRLLVETDAPFLAPEPKRGRTNEPALVRHTAKVLAHVKGVSEAEIAAITTANFFRLFSKASLAGLGRSGPAA